MAGMPEIGSKISLISKADIRYEGKLFTVDPNECTIALASVRSYGTEDREVENPVPPQAQTYEFILFRGSDIKDIRVVTNQLPNDPAIVQMTTVPPSMNTTPYQTHGFNLPVLGQSGPSMNQYLHAYNPVASMAPGMGRTMTKQPQPQQSELVNMVQVPEQVQSPLKEQHTVSSSELIGGSRASTPGLLGSRKSPTIDQGVQVSPNLPKDDKSHQRNIQQSYNRDNNRSRGSGVIGERPYNDTYRSSDSRMDYRPQRRDHFNMNNIRQQHQQPIGSQGPMMRSQGGQAIGGGNRGWVNRGGGGGGNNNMRQRGRGRNQQLPQNFNRAPGQQSQQQSNNQKTKTTLKFEGDYDFDKANTEFEELRSQLSKVKITEGGEAVAKVNGEDKKDDSGNETAIGEGEHDEEEQPVYYDKTKSFFDNISCEAVERSKGRSQRTDWRTERKLNSETFGVASARRGGFRGRGGYYNVGRGMYRGGGSGGGGYRGNYNRGQGNRPRNSNNPSSNSRPPVIAMAK
ncbi:LSM14 family protein trailer hitch [Lycorma delicatula]|uniref:LSM14 family protein trailer hitch n=1 Tax=Lycorma delicatula TaxID=130591 RepID=UPI003F50EE7C